MKGPNVTLTLTEMREAFDTAFALPVATDRPESEEFLLVRSRETRVAFRLTGISGVGRCPPLTPLPSGHPACAGLAGVRGTLTAVYYLSVLLGEERDGGGGSILQWSEDKSVALLFDELVGVRRVPLDNIVSAKEAQRDGGEEQLHVENVSYAIVSVPTLMKSLRTEHEATTTGNERQ